MSNRKPMARHEFTTVPIYDVRLHLVWGKWEKVKAERNRKKMVRLFGGKCEGEFDALLSYHGANFGLFFGSERPSHGLIAHEVLHATHRILEFIGHTFDSYRPEPHAYLCQWITEWVYKHVEER